VSEEFCIATQFAATAFFAAATLITSKCSANQLLPKSSTTGDVISLRREGVGV